MKKIILILSVFISVLVKAQSYTIMTTNYEWRNKNKYTRVDTVRLQDTSLLVLGADSLLRYITLSQLKEKARVESFWDTTNIMNFVVGTKVLSNSTVTLDTPSNLYSIPVVMVGGSDTSANFGILIKGSSRDDHGVSIEGTSQEEEGIVIDGKSTNFRGIAVEAAGGTDDLTINLVNGTFKLTGLSSGSSNYGIVTLDTVTSRIGYVSPNTIINNVKDTIIYVTDTTAIQNSFSNPIPLLPSISGKAYNPINCVVYMQYNGNPYDFGMMNEIAIGNNATNWFNALLIRPDQTVSRWYGDKQVSPIEMVPNTPIYFFATMTNATQGSSTFKIHLYYTIEEQ